MSLQYKFLIPLVLGSLALLLATTWLAYSNAIEEIRNRLIERADLTAITISESSRVIDDYSQMRFAIDEIAQKSTGVYGITLATRDPLIIWASSFRPGGDTDLETQEMLKLLALSAEKRVFGRYFHKKGDLIVTRPIEIADAAKKNRSLNTSVQFEIPKTIRADEIYTVPDKDFSGILYLRFDWEQIKQVTTNNLLDQILLISTGVVLIMLFSFGLLYHLVLGPVKNISSIAEAQREGKASARVNPASSDEIGSLGRTFNTMLDTLNERTQILQSLIEHMPMALLLKDTNKKHTISNKKFDSWFSPSTHDASDLLSLETLFENREEVENSVKQDRQSRSLEESIINTDGSTTHLMTTVFPVFDDENKVGWLGAISGDITEKKLDEVQLRQLHTAIESTRNGIIVVDLNTSDQTVVYANQAVEEITGYSPDEFIGKNCRFLHRDNREQKGLEIVRHSISHLENCKTILRNYKKDGTPFWNELSISVVRDQEGIPTHLIGVQDDVTERIKAEEQIEYLAYHDTLTNVANRALFNDRLAQAIIKASRNDEQVAVLYVDLDGFKRVNDSFGHKTGDHLLQDVTLRMSQCIRQEDTIGRMGGDEFTILIGGQRKKETTNTITLIANKVIASLSEPFNFEEHEMHISASVGIAIFPQDGTTAEELIKNADNAMYHVKYAGKNDYVFFREEINSDNKHLREIESALYKSLKKNELTLHYQPQFRIADMHLHGVEALLRWHNPKLGQIGPDIFIPIAENTGFINTIGEWVLMQACRDLKKWQDQGIKLDCVAVNLSVTQFRKKSLIKTITDCLEKTGLPPQSLELEITETAIIDDFGLINETLQKVKQLGVKVTVDDFGTGYSSLTYLKKLSVDTVKIDKLFVQGLPDDRDDIAIVKAILGMADGMGINIVAEGVETEEQLQFLKDAPGCAFAQGFHLCRPLPANKLVEFISKQH